MTHQKMRPLPTVSEAALVDLIAGVLREQFDDPENVAEASARKVFETLGIEKLTVQKQISHSVLDAQPYEELRDRVVEDAFNGMALKLGKAISSHVPSATSVTNNRWNRTKDCTLACWVLRTPEGSPDG